jgi:hypothetical protein
VNSRARLSTYRARTFRSRHLFSSGPTHHLIAVHLPKPTACGLVAPDAGAANQGTNRRRLRTTGMKKDPAGRECAGTDLGMMQPSCTQKMCTRSHVTSCVIFAAGIPRSGLIRVWWVSLGLTALSHPERSNCLRSEAVTESKDPTSERTDGVPLLSPTPSFGQEHGRAPSTPTPLRWRRGGLAQDDSAM